MSLRRAFSRFIRTPQSYQEFRSAYKTLPRHTTPYKSKIAQPKSFVESKENALATRDADIEYREVYTESSDFDVDNFSLKDYAWECIMFRNVKTT